MFGYIQPDKEEMKLKEYRRYRNYYCAVCNELRKKYGRITSIFVAYELVFTLVLLDDFSEQDSRQTIELSCQFEFARIGDIIINKELLSYIAWINLYLCKWKLFDNWVDDKNIFAYVISKFIGLNRNFKNDCLKYIQVSSVLDDNLNLFYNTEKNENDIDNLAQIMGEVWREILKPVLQIVNVDSRINEVLKSICEDMGKFIYFLDALDDYEKDMKKNKINPLRGFQTKGLDYKSCTLQILSLILYSLKQKLVLIELNRNSEIVGNIIQYGLERKVKSIIYNLEKKHARKK